jgi:hypothetical protein
MPWTRIALAVSVALLLGAGLFACGQREGKPEKQAEPVGSWTGSTAAADRAVRLVISSADSVYSAELWLENPGSHTMVFAGRYKGSVDGSDLVFSGPGMTIAVSPSASSKMAGELRYQDDADMGYQEQTIRIELHRDAL